MRGTTLRGAAQMQLATHRRGQRLQRAAPGLGHKKIARALNLAERTVKNPALALQGKLGIPDRMKAVLFAIGQWSGATFDQKA